jgi:hypothetical protein
VFVRVGEMGVNKRVQLPCNARLSEKEPLADALRFDLGPSPNEITTCVQRPIETQSQIAARPSSRSLNLRDQVAMNVHQCG